MKESQEIQLLRELQKVYPEGISIDKLKDRYPNSMIYIARLMKKEFLHHLPQGHIQLSEKGRDYIEELDRKREQNEILKSQAGFTESTEKWTKVLAGANIALAIATIVLAIATIALVIFTFIIGNRGIEIDTAQKDILEKTSQPYEAHIEDLPDFANLFVSSTSLTNDKIKDTETRWRGHNIPITLYNFGKMDAQDIECYWEDLYKTDSLWAYIYTGDEDNLNNFNLSAGSSKLLQINLFDSRVMEEGYIFNPSLVENGTYIINFTCDCIGCKEQRLFSITFPICVYTESKKECSETELRDKLQEFLIE
ncbi:MAG: hypothetical protein PHT54_04475 [Candidatus Nanoarchaeia archaeon]|nr:hypothetical protein [Candidatus Nanoarchaeia archaeon]